MQDISVKKVEKFKFYFLYELSDTNPSDWIMDAGRGLPLCRNAQIYKSYPRIDWLFNTLNKSTTYAYCIWSFELQSEYTIIQLQK